MRTYHVYILANRTRRIYVGFTGDLLVRMHQHRTGYYESYTKNFSIARLVYFEAFTDARSAIAREKQLKRWPRWRKVRLIEQHNLGWRDLAADWLPESRSALRHNAPGEA